MDHARDREEGGEDAGTQSRPSVRSLKANGRSETEVKEGRFHRQMEDV